MSAGTAAEPDPDTFDCTEQAVREYLQSEQDAIRVSWNQLYVEHAELAKDLIEQPDDALNTFLIEGAHKRLVDRDPSYTLGSDDLPPVRLVDFPPYRQQPVGAWSDSERLGELLVVEAQVAKAAQPQPQATRATFQCVRCDATVTMDLTETSRSEPHECESCERQGPWEIQRDECEFRDRQLLRLQEPPEKAHASGRGGARKIDAVATDDLCAETHAGKRAVVTGVLRSRPEPDNAADGGLILDTYLDIHSIEYRETDHESVAEDIGDEDRARIKEIAHGAEGEPLDALARSVSPHTYGHDALKKAIVLQLLGGVSTGGLGGGQRGEIHVLFIGDPSTAKSTLLDRAVDLSPRSAKANGKGATAAGITAAATQDDFGGMGGTAEWTLEPGAVVKANGGVAAIDELDKLNDGVADSLHETMSDQRLTINKADIDATLPARTSVLAAGNPEDGRFDDRYNPWEQIELDSTLINRFDLFFMTRDEPGEDDDKLADAVIWSREEDKAAENDDADRDHTAQPVSDDLVRKYVAYARRNCTPEMTDAAAAEAKSWWIDFRQSVDDDANDRVPVNARTLEAVTRLSEAAARARLAETVRASDVELATDMITEAMEQLGCDPDSGSIDIDVIETGASSSQRERRRQLEQLIAEIASEYEGGAPRSEVIDAATGAEGVDREQVEHDIQKLRDNGRLFEPNSGGLKTT
jgi:replicative DNA helicase Mcm